MKAGNKVKNVLWELYSDLNDKKKKEFATKIGKEGVSIRTFRDSQSYIDINKLTVGRVKMYAKHFGVHYTEILNRSEPSN
jgi:hypothetical protein